MRKLEILSLKVNECIKIADPKFFEDLEEFHKVGCEKYACLDGWKDPLLMEGREVLFNRISGNHLDGQDPRLGYAGLYSCGTFTSGGWIYFRQLKLKIRLLPGDFILIRGRVLEHEILEFDGGQRISIPHFTHTSLWRDLGMADRVDLPPK